MPQKLWFCRGIITKNKNSFKNFVGKDENIASIFSFFQCFSNAFTLTQVIRARVTEYSEVKTEKQEVIFTCMFCV